MSFFQRDLIFVKNSKFLSSLLFFEKGLDMYFYDVVYKKEGFLDNKNVIFSRFDEKFLFSPSDSHYDKTAWIWAYHDNINLVDKK